MLVQELAAIYQAKHERCPKPFRYVQFAQWQADLLESEEEDAKQGRDVLEARLADSLRHSPLPSAKKSWTLQFQAQRFALSLEQGVAATGSNQSTRSVFWRRGNACCIALSGQNPFRRDSLRTIANTKSCKPRLGASGGRSRSGRIESKFTFATCCGGRKTRSAKRWQCRNILCRSDRTDGDDLTSFAYRDLGGSTSAAGCSSRWSGFRW